MHDLTVFGTHQDNTLVQARDVASRAMRSALMADGHLGYIMPIGGVAAYRDQVSVAGVGFDIACGNAAIKTNLKYSDLGMLTHHHQLADEIQRKISFGVGRTNASPDAPDNHPLFDDPAWDAIPTPHERDKLKHKARQQLGTVGSGNHYVDVFLDEGGAIWVGVHFGSRGFGHTIASGFMSLAQGAKWDERVLESETLLSLQEELGERYWALMNLAGRYAYAGREWVARAVVKMLGGEEVALVHNHHNFAWLERHTIGDESDYFVVVRKGATPAFPGQLGFVGGSMGDNAVILQGTHNSPMSQTHANQKLALWSTVHGAGRVMSRTEAAGKRVRHGKHMGQYIMDKVTGLPKNTGSVTEDMMTGWINELGVILRGGGVDESPHVYRRLPEVLAAQGKTVEVLHTLKPLIVVMAGASEFDPYKD